MGLRVECLLKFGFERPCLGDKDLRGIFTRLPEIIRNSSVLFTNRHQFSLLGRGLRAECVLRPFKMCSGFRVQRGLGFSGVES